jgi:hypothetical protein
MMEKLSEVAKEIVLWNEEHLRVPMLITTKEKTQQANNCYMCRKQFTHEKEKCRDHDHLTGLLIGIACKKCNSLRREQRRTIPILFHNLKGYDMHHLIKSGAPLMKSKKWEVNIIPSTRETYLNMRVNIPIPGTGREGKKDKTVHLNFIDSLQFLSSSLANLASICPNLYYTNQLPVSDVIKKGKGILPYSYFDCPTKLTERRLPAIEDFFDTLTLTPCSEEDYQLAQLAWNEFKCVTLADYMAGKWHSHILFQLLFKFTI